MSRTGNIWTLHSFVSSVKKNHSSKLHVVVLKALLRHRPSHSTRAEQRTSVTPRLHGDAAGPKEMEHDVAEGDLMRRGRGGTQPKERRREADKSQVCVEGTLHPFKNVETSLQSLSICDSALLLRLMLILPMLTCWCLVTVY